MFPAIELFLRRQLLATPWSDDLACLGLWLDVVGLLRPSPALNPSSGLTNLMVESRFREAMRAAKVPYAAGPSLYPPQLAPPLLAGRLFPVAKPPLPTPRADRVRSLVAMSGTYSAYGILWPLHQETT